MERRYFIAPGDASFMTSSGLLPAPDGWTEVTAEECQQRLAEQRAAQFLMGTTN